jgi:hypothetical protein
VKGWFSAQTTVNASIERVSVQRALEVGEF